MSDTEFKASNGRTVTDVGTRAKVRIFREEQNMLDGFNFLNTDDLEALEEYLQHKRDEELGRWRWPEDPEYVVYPKKPAFSATPPGFRVVHEETGRSRDVDKGVVQKFGAASSFGDAVKAYLEAHPEPKPWQDAKEGEVWLITSEYRDNEPALVTGKLFQFREGHDIIDSTVITSARRIYPEGDNK